MSSSNRTSSAVPASAISTFRVHKPPQAKTGRAKYTPKRGQEVNAVREKRACLRCSLLKIPCSHDIFVPRARSWPSLRMRSALYRSPHALEQNWWKLKTNLAVIPSPDTRRTVLERSRFLALRSITLDFSSEITWDLPNLTLELIEWLKNPAISTTSKVGILSSPDFFYLVNSYISDEISMNFQRMLYAESLAYIQPTTNDKHHLSVPELQQIGAIAGHNILIFLDRKLKPESLRNCSKGDLEALFLLVIGTILAVSYAHNDVKGDVSLHWATPSKDLGHGTQFQTMQNHLCQILAHYLVYLGSKLSLLSAASHTEKFILEGATSRWHKEGIFLWSTRSTHGPKTDRLHQSGSCLHITTLSGPDDNSITPTQSYQSQDSHRAWDPLLSEDLPNIAPLEPDPLWEARFPLHHPGGNSLSPSEEVQSNNQSLSITSPQTRFSLKENYHPRKRHRSIDGLRWCAHGLRSCSYGGKL